MELSLTIQVRNGKKKKEKKGKKKKRGLETITLLNQFITDENTAQVA